MKKILLILTICIFNICIFNSQIVSAHTSKQGGTYQWGEVIGWSIDEDYHTNSTLLYYKFDSTDTNLTESMKTTVRNGASKWSSYGSITESSSAIGTICTFYDSNTTTVAKFYNYSSNSSGHLTSWKIGWNRAKSPTATTMAHEFGHAYGLNDLQDTMNTNKLMFGTESRTATGPTTQDGKGFRVIVGTHYNHGTLVYKKIPNAPSSLPMHHYGCSTCDIFKTSENCSPSSGMCTKCRLTH